MGLDTPTPTGSSSAASISSQHSQQTGGVVGCFAGVDPFSQDGLKKEILEQQHSMMGAGGEDDNFPEDLNGLDGIGPLASGGPAGLMDPKAETFFGFGTYHLNLTAPASANGLQHPHHAAAHQQAFNGPGSAPAGPCSTDSGHSSSGGWDQPQQQHGKLGSHQTRLVKIRDPFGPDEQSPSSAGPGFGHSPLGQSQQEQLAPLNWDGKPPQDARSMAESTRLSTEPLRPPMVPVPNMKEGGITPGAMLPQWSFFSTPMQRQRLEQMYPPGSFPPSYWSRWSPMPVPMMRPMLPPAARLMLVPMRPGTQLPPGALPPWLAPRIPPGMLPVMVIPGPNGQPIPLQLNFHSIHPAMLFGPAGLQPPPPGPGAPPGAGAQQQTPGPPPAGGGAAGKAGAAGGGQTNKPKKETAKQRKQREKVEERQREAQEREQQQQQQAMAMGRSPPVDGSGLGQPQLYAPPGMLTGPNSAGQQQDCFKVPGRSPPLKRCTSSLPPPSAPTSVPLQQQQQLMPMPEQRIHELGDCSLCHMEINSQRKAIQCTAISQGCNQLFHYECAGLTHEAFTEFCRDSRLEWICQSCFNFRNKEQCLAFAC